MGKKKIIKEKFSFQRIEKSRKRVEKLRKKRYIFGAAGIMLGVVSFTGFTAAYLTRPVNEVRNVITAGNVKAAIIEEHWNAEKALKVYPGQVLSKDPVIKNTGDNAANVFLEVTIPIENIETIDEKTGIKIQRESQELFSFQAENTDWKLLYQEQTAECKKYVYGYTSPLAPGEMTTPLFQEITAIHYVAGELNDKKDYQIPVVAKAIQVQTGSRTLEEIYQDYLKQNESDSKEEM